MGEQSAWKSDPVRLWFTLHALSDSVPANLTQSLPLPPHSFFLSPCNISLPPLSAAGHVSDPVWEVARGSVLRGPLHLLVPVCAVCHRAFPLQDPTGLQPGENTSSFTCRSSSSLPAVDSSPPPSSPSDSYPQLSCLLTYFILSLGPNQYGIFDTNTNFREKNFPDFQYGGWYSEYLSLNENRPLLCGLCTDFIPLWLSRGTQRAAFLNK